jgi:hypothetical protein
LLTHLFLPSVAKYKGRKVCGLSKFTILSLSGMIQYPFGVSFTSTNLLKDMDTTGWFFQ